METRSDSSTVEESVTPTVEAEDLPTLREPTNVEAQASAVEAGVVTPKKAPRKVAPKAKKAAAARKRKKPAAKKVAAAVVEPVPVPLNREEIVETLTAAKDEFVVAIGAPVMGIVGKYSQMARDGLSGLVSGFLGNKKRDD